MRLAKYPRPDTHCTSDVNESECCVCYVTYEDDRSGKEIQNCTQRSTNRVVAMTGTLLFPLLPAAGEC